MRAGRSARVWTMRGPEDLDAALITELGSSLKHLWVPNADRVSVTGTNTNALNDAKGTGHFAHLSGSASWLGDSGPGARPRIALTSTDALLAATTVDFASGSRTSVYVVGRLPGTGGDTPLFMFRSADSSASSAVLLIGQSGGNKFRAYASFTAGTQDVASTVAADANWHLFSIRPLSTGASWQIDGVEASPTFSGTSTLNAIGSAHIGHGSLANGSFAGGLVIDNPTTAQHLAINSWARRRFGIAVA